jgi:uncharacterized iron-regulated membrane protein
MNNSYSNNEYFFNWKVNTMTGGITGVFFLLLFNAGIAMAQSERSSLVKIATVNKGTNKKVKEGFKPEKAESAPKTAPGPASTNQNIIPDAEKAMEMAPFNKAGMEEESPIQSTPNININTNKPKSVTDTLNNERRKTIKN